MGSRHEIILKNDHAELPRLAEEVESFLAAHDASDSVIFKINLVLDELVTNILSYGYPDQATTHEIAVRLGLQGREVELTIDDDGIAFNPLDAVKPDLEASLEDRVVGGLGVHFMREIMARVEYRREAGHNVLVMARSLDEEAAAPQ